MYLFTQNSIIFKNDAILSDPMSFSSSLLGAFDVLSKRLRLIEDIPLKVSSVQPLDPGISKILLSLLDGFPCCNDMLIYRKNYCCINASN